MTKAADDAEHPADGSPEFEQLALDATITGPGMRTEDPYEPGTKLKIKGERGSFEYKYASLSRAGLVSLHLVGDRGSRAVRPDQVVLVRKTRFRK
jgi:hypothetical protein